MMYEAMINVPGYLPMSDDQHVFDTVAGAWLYLRDERLRDLEDPMNDEDEDSDDGPCLEMESLADEGVCTTVYGWTPGYYGDHDLGVAYTVSLHTCDAMCDHDDL
jgi:hypothetical protein